MAYKTPLLRGLTVALVLLIAGSGLTFGQKLVKCPQKNRIKEAPKYRIGRILYTVENPPTPIITISIKPQHFNREDMIALARQLKKDFCYEQRFTVFIFDDYRAASDWTPINEVTKASLRLRGMYVLDLTIGREEISFSPDPNRQEDEIKINLRSVLAP